MTETGDFDSRLRDYLDARARDAVDPAAVARLVDRTVNGDGRRRRWKPLASVALGLAAAVLVGAPTTLILLHRSVSPRQPAAVATFPGDTQAAIPGVSVTRSGPPSPWRENAAFGSGPGLPLLLYGGFAPARCLTTYADTYLWDGSHWYEQRQDDGPKLAYASVGWDPIGKRLLLVGEPPPSCTEIPSGPTQTWEWQTRPGLTGKWAQLTPAHEPAGVATSTSLATDAQDDDLFLLVHDDAPGTAVTRAWTWDGNDWTARGSWTCGSADQTCPTIPRYVVQSRSGGVAGICSTGTALSLCTLTDNSWSGEPGTAVQASATAVPSWNPVTDDVVLTGWGSGANTGPGLFTYDGSRWEFTPLPAELRAASQYSFASESTAVTHLVLWGGIRCSGTGPQQQCAELSDTWVFDGTTWARSGP